MIRAKTRQCPWCKKESIIIDYPYNYCCWSLCSYVEFNWEEYYRREKEELYPIQNNDRHLFDQAY